MPFKIIRNDITKMETDAVVNAANTHLAPGSGVCGAIFAAAGYDKLAAACAKIGGCPTGGAVITRGYDLKTKYIIHTAGPVYNGGKAREAEALYSCYKSSLELAKRKRLKSIAFPLISSGIYGYPKAEALKIATAAVTDFLTENEMEIYLVVYDKRAFETSAKLFADVKAYIDDTMVRRDDRRQREEELYYPEPRMCAPEPNFKGKAFGTLSGDFMPNAADLKSRLKNMDKSFSETLLALIDESGMTDAEVYKKANVDRRLFSKIRANANYKPSKVTAVAFAIALELDMTETRDLLAKAGYSMTHSSEFDIIIEYFIQRKNYNVFEINEILFAFDQSLIGV